MILNWNVEHQTLVYIFNFQLKPIYQLATNNPEYHNFFPPFFSSIELFLIKIETVHIRNANIIDYLKKKHPETP